MKIYQNNVISFSSFIWTFELWCLFVENCNHHTTMALLQTSEARPKNKHDEVLVLSSSVKSIFKRDKRSTVNTKLAHITSSGTYFLDVITSCLLAQFNGGPKNYSVHHGVSPSHPRGWFPANSVPRYFIFLKRNTSMLTHSCVNKKRKQPLRAV